MALDFTERLADKLRGWVAPPLARGRRSAQVLAVASSKGGVGKTTTAVNLSVAFAKAGLHTLLIDLDPQAHVATALQLGTQSTRQMLAEVLKGSMREVMEVTFASPWPRLTVAGSDESLAETEMVLSAKIGKELLLHGALQVTRTHYDLIVIDCPPHIGTLTLNALCAADSLLVPADMSVLALKGVSDMLSCVDTLRFRLNRPIEVCGILSTRLDKRLREANAAVSASLQDRFGDKVLNTQIPQASAINRAHIAGVPIFDYAPQSLGAKAYQALSEELLPLLNLSPQARANLHRPAEGSATPLS